jgi:hypothetical protein
MLIKFYETSPNFEESIRILKRRYGTTASSRAVRRCVLEFSKKGLDYEQLLHVIELKDNEIKELRLVINALLGYRE